MVTFFIQFPRSHQAPATQVKHQRQTHGENVLDAEAGRAGMIADTPAFQDSAGSLMTNPHNGNVRTASDMCQGTQAVTLTFLVSANGLQLPQDRGDSGAVRTPDQEGSKPVRIQLLTCRDLTWALKMKCADLSVGPHP